MGKYTVKEHYIPRFFLERFADKNGVIYVYDIERDIEYESNYEMLGFEKNLYETRWDEANQYFGDYVLRNDIEKVLAKYDFEFSSFLRELDRKLIPDQNPEALICNKQEKIILKRLIANFIFRNPITMKQLNGEDELKKVMSSDEVKIISELMEKMDLGGTGSLVNAALKKVTVTEEIEGGYAGKFIKLIDKVPFMFFYSKSNGFIISDMPVSVGVDRNAIGDNKTCVFLPLSSQYAILFGNYNNMKKNKVVFIDEKNTQIMVGEYIKKNVEKKNKLYFNSKAQRSYIVSRIKESAYA